MDKAFVNYDIRDKVGIITFYHPKSNSLPSDILNELANKIKIAGEDDKINIIVLRSEGDKSFCAGASFDELLNIETFEQGREFFLGFARVILEMKNAPKFILTRVQGKAVGGGVGLIAASDYALAYKDASVKLSEYAVGLGPNVIGPAVERKIGKAAFSQMSIDFEWYNSTWAMNKGLYANVYYTISDLDEAIVKLAQKLAEASPLAARELKKIFWEGTDNWEQLLEQRAEISGRLVMSEYTKNYINQFKNK
jgi:methylglutaconyl-CoA hydratase